jgi:hypothetical protein
MADYSYDSTGIDPDAKGSFVLLPEGQYSFVIKEAKPGQSKNGNFMVTLSCEVVNNVNFNGKTVTHYVTFFEKDKPGAGIPIHFLKVIGQPWEGQFDVTVADWIGGEFLGYVKHDEYTSKKDGLKYKNAKISRVEKETALPF